ncbi:MAG: hypothetical protein U0X75_01725 [Acidobacteriota bacterium]
MNNRFEFEATTSNRLSSKKDEAGVFAASRTAPAKTVIGQQTGF